MRLSNQVALIPGAASGIGRATALRFAREGARVVVVDRQEASRLESEPPPTAAAIQAAGGEALFVTADMTRRAEVDAAVDAALGRFGRIDILVNNAGVFIRNAITDVSDEEWEQVLNLNLR